MEEVRGKKFGMAKGCLIAVGIAVALAVFVPVATCSIAKTNRENDVKAKGELVVKLLNENYHDKFAIADGRFIWATDDYQFTAYPVNEPDFKFMVLISRLSKSGISCSYLFLRRVHDLEKQVKPYIDSLTSKNFFLANIGTGGLNSKDGNRVLDYADENQITSADTMLKKFPYMLKNYTGITYCYDVTEGNKETIAKDIYNLLCFYREKKFGIIDISISFYGSKLFNDEEFKKAANDSPGHSLIGKDNEYKAKNRFSIFEKYSEARNEYLPTRYGDKGVFTDTDRIITNYKDIEKRMTKILKKYQKQNNKRD